MKPRYDRAAIMRDAHKRYRDGKRLGLGWSFGRCLSTAWQAAKMRQEGVRYMAAALPMKKYARQCQAETASVNAFWACQTHAPCARSKAHPQNESLLRSPTW